MFGFEVSLQAQASVAAVPQPQLPGSGGGVWLVAGFGAVGVEVRQDVLADPVQRRGVKRPSMTSQLSFGGLTVRGPDLGHDSGLRSSLLR